MDQVQVVVGVLALQGAFREVLINLAIHVGECTCFSAAHHCATTHHRCESHRGQFTVECSLKKTK
jgi:hypothetical protein